MKRFIALCILTLMLPTLLSAQSPSAINLVERYAKHSDVDHTSAGRSIIWMIKAATPKGAMDGVKKLDILNFEGGTTSESYKSFRRDAMAHFEAIGAKCLSSEETKDGSMEIFMERKEQPTEYMMFMHSSSGEEVVMLMRGDLPSSF